MVLHAMILHIIGLLLTLKLVAYPRGFKVLYTMQERIIDNKHLCMKLSQFKA